MKPSPPKARDVFDELAAMFMTGDEHASTTKPDVQCETILETIIVGHLPVRAGLWLVPYVDRLARSCGPAAMIRLDDEHPTLELLRTKSPRKGLSNERSLHDSIASVADEVGTWFVRGPEDIEPGELVRARPDQLTILTGADTAAVVRAYQIIKCVQIEADRMDHPMPRCGVAIVGASEEEARTTFERIQRTAGSQLGVEVELRCILSRMDAELISSGFVHFEQEPSPTVAEILDWIRDARRSVVADDEASERSVAPERHAALNERDVERAAREMAEAWTGVEREPVHTTAEEAMADGRVRTMKLVPKPSMELKPRRREASSAPESPTPQASSQSQPTSSTSHDSGPAHRGDERAALLSAYVPGLTPIKPRCPRHEAIELAVDARSDLHLLARETNLRELSTVETWARDHRKLLAMASGDAKVNPRGEVICHVFAESPISVADLHATPLHLHVLAPVQVEGRTGWYAAPLNQPVGSTSTD